MNFKLRKFLYDPQFTEFRDFLLFDERRLMNSMPSWIASQVPELNIAVVHSPSLENLVENISKKNHRLNILLEDELPDFASKNNLDAVILESITPQLTNQLAKIDASIFYLYSEQPMEKFTQLVSPDYLSFFKAFVKSKNIAPLYIASKDAAVSRNFANLLDSIGTYFSTHAVSIDEFKLIHPQSQSVVVYIDDPKKGDNGRADLELISLLEDVNFKQPVIYFKPSRFWRDHNLDELFQKGLFDFVASNMGGYLDENLPDDEKREAKILVGLERVANAAHAGFFARFAGFERNEAFDYVRKHIPYVFFHSSRIPAVDLMTSVVLSGSAITMHPHIGKELKNFQDMNTIAESVRIAKAWKPNVIYIDLKNYSSVRVDKDHLEEFLSIRKLFPDAALILSYDSTKLSPSKFESFLTKYEKEFKGGLVEHVRHPVRPIIADTVKRAWELFKESRKSTVVIERSKIKNLILNQSKFILDTSVSQLERMLSSRFESERIGPPIYIGQPVYPGATNGKLHLNLEQAIASKRRGERVLFYVEDISQVTLNEVKELRKLDGVLFNKVAFENHQTIDLQRSGVPMIKIDNFSYKTHRVGLFSRKEVTEYTLGNATFTSEQPISFDGATGEVFFGKYNVIHSQIDPSNLSIDKPFVKQYRNLMESVDKVLSQMNLEVMINADNIAQILDARKWGATSVGLVRSENILRESEKNLFTYGRLLLSVLSLQKLTQDESLLKKQNAPFSKMDEENCNLVLKCQEEFGKVQEEAFYKILKVQKGNRTQIRLLDPSLSELFSEKDLERVVLTVDKFYKPAEQLLYEVLKNKSIRGVRLLVWPEIYNTQLAALFNAYVRVKKEGEPEPDLRIFIPYVDNYKQVELVKTIAERIASDHPDSSLIKYEIGVTLETPGGCASAPEMIKKLHIKNFAFGTNDLFPLIDGTGSRNEGPGTFMSYVGRAKDNTLLLSDGILRLLNSTISSMEAAAKEEKIEYSLGICGEMNEVKLHNENLGQYLTRAHYISAGRAQQIPILKLIIAQNYLKQQGF